MTLRHILPLTLAAGTLPALIPFAFALYRFYAEVNRLLPPNL